MTDPTKAIVWGLVGFGLFLYVVAIGACFGAAITANTKASSIRWCLAGFGMIGIAFVGIPLWAALAND